ncbi:MAG: response regulator transcription factor, partial [Fidelibacterota bacterium]
MKDDIRVFIADDHPIFRKGLRNVIESTEGVTLQGEATDGDTALRLIEELVPDIAIVDVNMPGMSGIDVAKAVQA